MPKIEMRSRKAIAEFLPEALNTAIASYQLFSEEEDTGELKKTPTKFKAHHDACKVAIAHIQLLIKLAEWADLPDPSVEGEVDRKDLLALINSARGELEGGG